MQLFHVLSLLNFLFVHGFLQVNCAVIEFEKFVPPAGPCGRQPVILEEDGGYTNLLVAIHRDVKESSSIIDGIKEIFTLTSQMLHNATDQTLYFREISILVPDNWNDSFEYERSRPNETFQTARVIIRNEKSQGSPPSYPFVRQLGGGESEAEYMYLPSGMITSRNETLKNENADQILNLWGRLRWGLVETHIQSYEQRSPSLTYKTLWEECMKNSIDFQSSKDKQIKNHTDAIPNFRILRHRDIFSVVILDARENMKENNKFERMKEKFENYVWNLFPAYSWVGVVVVNDESRKLLPVIKLWESPGFRENSIIHKLPRSTNSTSSLGEGLIIAKRMLSDVRQDITGSFIFIMSDGTDDIPPTVNEVMQEVSSEGVVFASLPFSTNISENIIMNNTINQNFTIKDTNQLYRLEDENRFEKIFQSSEVTFMPYQSRRFYLSMERNTNMDSVIVRVRVNDSTVPVDVQYYTENDLPPSEYGIPHFTEDSQIMDIVIYEKAIQGLEIQSNVSQILSFEVFSTTSMFDKEIAYIDEAIRTYPSSKSRDVNFNLIGVPLYVSITKNENPVMNVSTATAVITSPDGVASRLPLLDDGHGADVQLQDGIYSNYFNSFTTEGEYTVEFQVISGEGSCVLGISPKELTRTLPLLEPNVCGTNNSDPLSPFQRFPPPFSLTVTAIPPNTVTDLKASIDESKRIVEFSWTAAGEDLTIGRADKYEIRYCEETSDIANNFDSATDISECSSSNKKSVRNVSSEKEYFCGDFSKVEVDVFIIAIRAIDSHGNKGNVSNGIQVIFPIDEKTTTVPMTTKAASVSVINKMTDILQTKPFIATSIVCVVVSLAVIVGLRKYLTERKTQKTMVFTPKSKYNRVSPVPSRCHSSSGPCTPDVIVLEDI